jgi:hypothetical protein
MLPLRLIMAGDEQPLIEVTSAVDTSRITIGDRITYTISIDYADSLRIERPGEGINLGQFEIKDYRIHDPLEKNQRINQKFEYVISVFDTGTFIIPPFPVAYFPSALTEEYKIIEASAITIYVESVLAGGDNQLRDIKPPIDIPYDYIFLISVAVAVILILIAVYLGYRLYRKRKESGYLFSPPPPPRPAHEIALESIDRLLAKNLLQAGEIKQFYIEISEILRLYIEGRYYIHALEETSTEIINELRKQDLTESVFNLAREALSLADLVKFAKYKPADQENKQIVEWVRSFVEETMLVYNQATEYPLKKDYQEQTVNEETTSD